ncbi:MAG: HupE/UreJ family protein [Hyphomicrobiales bacterium]|nr:HupE/UreJ family protein [Hyphomicrobiales bacterium]
MFGRLACVLTIALATLAASPASAHFKLNLNVRILHVEHTADGLDVYLRLPMPYLVADKLGPVGPTGDPAPAPFTTNGREDGQLVHFLDPEQVGTDPKGLGEIVLEGHPVDANGGRLAGAVVAVRAHRRGEEPDFATLDEAKAAFADPVLVPAGTPPYVGDTVIDARLQYRSDGPLSQYRIRSTLDPGLPGQEDTANLIIDYGAGGAKIYRARGLLGDGVEVSRSSFAAMRTFFEQGIIHILSGLDHVLFVLCLVIGANTLFSLVERVTGFTLGHTVTLIAGFFGYVPEGSWFIPAVELGIAVTIVYAAWLAIRNTYDGRRDTWKVFAITTVIGLLHGLGFSFVLHEILQVDSPNLWQSLIAFNVGVEAGQLAIVLVVWPVFLILRYISRPVWRYARYSTAAVCSLIAAVWIVQRSELLLNA